MTSSDDRSIVIVEDDRLERERLRLLVSGEPGLACAGAFPSAEEFLRFEKSLEPDLVILDLELGRISGIDCLKELLRRGRSYPVYVLTNHDDPGWFFAALESGAMGYSVKGISATKTIDTLHALLAGEARIDASVAYLMRKRFIDAQKANENFSKLTERETETLKFLASGLTDKEVAKELGLSHKTIENRVGGILKKLHACSRTQAVATAMGVGFWWDIEG